VPSDYLIFVLLFNLYHFSSESMSSIRSSSGVSSTSSLSHCNSDLESTHDAPEGRLGVLRASPCSEPPASPVRPLPDVLIAVSEPEEKSKEDVACHSINSQAYSQPQPSYVDKKLVAIPNLGETDNLPSEDEEFDSLAYQRATGSIKLRRNKVEMGCEGDLKAVSREDVPMNHDEGDRSGRSDSNGSKKPKDLLNFLLTDGSIESSYVT